ncbi:hypothetical protein HK100_008859 [Physocladia obscura]|uniref:Uncharacterized protein n=1 Tax=Physocladia obscura TaxID=109957 RepID=A0AAD5XMG3_9FUNG|nr:hypothetical protein HK100_008859 [Physocladia obscura]
MRPATSAEYPYSANAHNHLNTNAGRAHSHSRYSNQPQLQSSRSLYSSSPSNSNNHRNYEYDKYNYNNNHNYNHNYNYDYEADRRSSVGSAAATSRFSLPANYTSTSSPTAASAVSSALKPSLQPPPPPSPNANAGNSTALYSRPSTPSKYSQHQHSVGLNSAASTSSLRPNPYRALSAARYSPSPWNPENDMTVAPNGRSGNENGNGIGRTHTYSHAYNNSNNSYSNAHPAIPRPASAASLSSSTSLSALTSPHSHYPPFSRHPPPPERDHPHRDRFFASNRTNEANSSIPPNSKINNSNNNIPMPRHNSLSLSHRIHTPSSSSGVDYAPSTGSDYAPSNNGSSSSSSRFQPYNAYSRSPYSQSHNLDFDEIDSEFGDPSTPRTTSSYHSHQPYHRHHYQEQDQQPDQSRHHQITRKAAKPTLTPNYPNPSTPVMRPSNIINPITNSSNNAPIDFTMNNNGPHKRAYSATSAITNTVPDLSASTSDHNQHHSNLPQSLGANSRYIQSLLEKSRSQSSTPPPSFSSAQTAKQQTENNGNSQHHRLETQQKEQQYKKGGGGGVGDKTPVAKAGMTVDVDTLEDSMSHVEIRTDNPSTTLASAAAVSGGEKSGNTFTASSLTMELDNLRSQVSKLAERLPTNSEKGGDDENGTAAALAKSNGTLPPSARNIGVASAGTPSSNAGVTNFETAVVFIAQNIRQGLRRAISMNEIILGMGVPISTGSTIASTRNKTSLTTLGNMCESQVAQLRALDKMVELMRRDEGISVDLEPV